MGIDKDIKDTFKDRAIQPSSSAWERLSDQLDRYARRKRRRRFFYIGSAASILLLVSIFLVSTRTNVVDDPIQPEKMMVKEEVQVPEIKKDQDHLSKMNDAVIVNTVISEKEVAEKRNVHKKKATKAKKLIPVNIPKKIITEEAVAVIEKPESNTKGSKSTFENSKKPSRISVNSDALLYSVTHTEEEVVAYYRAHKLDREDVLNSIKLQLKKSNLKIDARTILADVERDIDDASFKENFMKLIKKRVSDLATAIASRND